MTSFLCQTVLLLIQYLDAIMVDTDVQMKHKYISIASQIIYDIYKWYIYT